MSPAHQHEDISLNLASSSEATLAQPAPTPPQLVALRATIDNLDAVLVHVLAERFKCTRQVGELKRDLDLPSRGASPRLRSRPGVCPEVL